MENKELMIIPGAVHTDLYDGGDNNYIPFDKMTAFFEEYLKQVTGQSSIADVMLICTGTSNRHVVAIAQRLSDELYKIGLKNIRMSGEQNGEWVIVDTGSVMVHIMQQEVRERYELDDLYRCMAAGV